MVVSDNTEMDAKEIVIENKTLRRNKQRFIYVLLCII